MTNQLPNGWITVVLGELGKIVTGKTPSTKIPENFNGNIPFIKPSDLDERGYIHSTVETLSEKGLKSVSSLPIGSITVTCIGNLGKTGITTKLSATNQQINSVICNDGINNKYLYYFLTSMRGWLESESSATTIAIVNKSKFSLLPVSLPPLPEQKEITTRLDNLLAQVDTLKTRLDAIPAILKRFRQSVLAAAVSGKLTEEWRNNNPELDVNNELKKLLRIRNEIFSKKEKADKPKNRQPNNINLTEIPKTWCYCYIDQFLSMNRTGMKTGPFGSLLKREEHISNGIPVLGIENIGYGVFIKNSKIHITEAKAEELKSYDILAGDLIISRSGTVGDICVIPNGIDAARFSTNLMRLSLNSNYLNPHFFSRLFLGSPIVLQQVAELCKGSTRLFLNQTILSSIKYPIPPFNEQTEIVRRVEQLFAFADQIEQRVQSAQKRVNHLTQAILAKAFRGELTADWREQNPDLISGENSAEALLARIKTGKT